MESEQIPLMGGQRMAECLFESGDFAAQFSFGLSGEFGRICLLPTKTIENQTTGLAE